MRKIPPIWLTIDSDDVFHHPKYQGHPTRSKKKIDDSQISEKLISAISRFKKWHLDNIHIPITIFVIAKQLECRIFKEKIANVMTISKNNNGKIIIGCHGYQHKCWSAFEPNEKLFEKDLQKAKKILSEFAGSSWRPWFRAPGGYIAPWMAEVLKKLKFELDTSINPTILLSIKSGKSNTKFRFNGWKSVDKAIKKVDIVERPWLTTFFSLLPTCGPALHIPILRGFARQRWRKMSNSKSATEHEILDPKTEITTVYWHLLDFNHKNGFWTPPLRLK